MIEFMIMMLPIAILVESLIENKRYGELKDRVFDLEMKNTELKLLMSNILDIFSKNGQSRTKSECSDLPGNEEPENATNANI